MFHTLNTVGQLYVGLFGVSGFLCLAAVTRARQIDDPDVRRGLVWLLATSGGWSLFKTVFFLVENRILSEAAYIVGLGIGFATVWAWLYFCSAYTGRNYHHNTSLRRTSAAVFLAVISVKVTNPFHGLYFTTELSTTPFTYFAIEHNVLHWAATGLSYVLAAVGLFMIFQLFVESGYDTRPLSFLTVLIGIPVVVDVIAQLTPRIINVIYAPLGVAAFAVGVLFVFERQFVALQQTSADGDGASIYLDESGQVRDYSEAARAVVPELGGSTGEPLAEVAPPVAAAVETEDKILEHDGPDGQRYYFVSDSTVTLGDAGVQVVQLSDVTQTERQRRELAERERELDEQNELYRAVIDASFASVFRLDTDGRFTFISPSVEEFLGYSSEDLKGELVSVTHSDEATTERAWKQLEPVLEGEANKVRDFPLQTKSGTEIYTDVRGVPIYDGSVPEAERTTADIVGIQLMVRDATNRREREGLISVTNRVLRHNLRNKMTVIASYANILEEKLDGNDAEKATQIKNTADRLLDLSESAQKIDENRELSPELEPIDILPIIDRCVTQLQMQYPEASVTVNANDTVVARTHERLETALWEVIDNAAKHGGDSPVVNVDVTTTERQVVVTVTDNGPGLPDMEREVLESNTETQLVHGDGLGLWLVYWIVTSLEGEVDAEVSSDGTSVTVRLPKPA